MKPFIATIINAITLIVMGMWGYFGSSEPSPTAFIPVISGIILLLLARGIKNENRTIAHTVVLLTLIILIALFKPLTGSISRHDYAAVSRVIIMMLTSLIAIAFYVWSFIDARRQRG